MRSLDRPEIRMGTCLVNPLSDASRTEAFLAYALICKIECDIQASFRVARLELRLRRYFGSEDYAFWSRESGLEVDCM